MLDPFLGSGSTLMAAEKTGRCCRGVELDPLYVDVILHRYEAETGQSAVLEEPEKRWTSFGKSASTAPSKPGANNSRQAPLIFLAGNSPLFVRDAISLTFLALLKAMHIKCMLWFES